MGMTVPAQTGMRRSPGGSDEPGRKGTLEAPWAVTSTWPPPVTFTFTWPRTGDRQDPVASRARQREQAAALVDGYGQIVAEYFDDGQSRVLPWSRRPQAAALVAAMADPDRAFDAIVVGEYERAFYGNQFALMVPFRALRRAVVDARSRRPDRF
jgi:hypothetical protein